MKTFFHRGEDGWLLMLLLDYVDYMKTVGFCFPSFVMLFLISFGLIW